MIDVTRATLDELAEQIHETAVDKGWWDPEQSYEDRFDSAMMLIHSEISEAYEEYRMHQPFKNFREVDGKPEGIAVELADAVIRILDLCYALRIPLVQAMESKMEYNKTRPYRHGNKKV